MSERKSVEKALRESEQRYRALFNQAPLGVLHFDRDLRVIACNTPLSTALGFDSPDEMIGFDLNGLRDQRVLPTFRQALTGEPSLYEGPYRATHRKLHVWIALHVSPLHGADGDVVGGIAMIEDITARKLAEAQLVRQTRELAQINLALQERSREVEAALESRNRLYTAMSHELRTPISAIMLYNDLLLADAMGPLSEEQAESIQHSQSAAEHLLGLVQDVLDLARLDAGKLPIALESISVHRLARDLVDTIWALAEHRGSQIDLQLDEPDPLVVTDARRVRQILLNLLSNALKFGEGRAITFRCTPTPEGGAKIAVADQGRGIAPDDRARIFEDFVQVGDHREVGSGLGLSISQRLATLLGGSLEVESQPGQGSTFCLTLPPAPPHESDHPNHPLSSTGSS